MEKVLICLLFLSTADGWAQKMSDKAKEMEAFLKINNLDLKERRNLVRIFEQYNSL